MPSQLVDDVRRLIREREEAGRPVTALERTFIEAALVPKRNTPDLVDELEGALADARTYLLADPPAHIDADTVDRVRRMYVRKLIAAARAILDHDPAREEHDPAAVIPEPDPDRRLRADVDG